MICECCGSEIAKLGDIVLELRTNEVRRAGQSVKLRPTGAEILTVLMEKHPHPVKTVEFEYRIWPHQEITHNCISVHLALLRRSLKPLGISILCERGPATSGYWLALSSPPRPPDCQRSTAGVASAAPAFSGV